jgi:phosphoglycerate dehydrogenase-like enzyme
MRERTRFDAERLARLGDLRLLVTTGMGNAAIDLEAAAAKGIVVSGTRGRTRHTVELTWALILALLRSIPAEDTRMRQGGWQQTIGTELDGATLGLVGLGRLGSAMVPIARAFGMDVVAWSQNLDADRAAEAGAEAVSKDELFRRADVVSVHYKLSPRSEGIVGPAEIAAMKPTAYFVNTSRGPLVDQDALLDALAEGRLAGAGLDVFAVEPPGRGPLAELENVVMSPHCGGISAQSNLAMSRMATESVLAVLAGAPRGAIANPDVLRASTS